MSAPKNIKQSSQENLYLIDGNAYMYRNFYAIPEMFSKKGQPTNAIFGFIKLILKFLKNNEITHLAVTFDTKGKTKRHQAYKEYKASRPPMPPELVTQMGHIRTVLKAMNIPFFENPEYEADDFLATLATHGKKQNQTVTIITEDKDIFQLVDKNIHIFSVHKNQLYGTDEVFEKYGIKPNNFVDLLGLAGDKADNIPGIPGVGIKTATRLIQQFGSIESIIESSSKIKTANQRNKVEKYAEQALLSKSLAKLEKNIPGCEDIDSLKIVPPDKNALYKLFLNFDFFSFIKEMNLQEEIKVNQALIASSFERIKSGDTIKSQLSSTSICYILEEDTFIAIKISKEKPIYIMSKENIKEISSLFEAAVTWVGFDLKELIKRTTSFKKTSRFFDLKLASYINFPGQNKYDLKDLALQEVNKSWLDSKDLALCGHHLSILEDFHKKIQDDLKEKDLLELFFEIEMPLSVLLAKIEHTGIKVNGDLLIKISQKNEKQINDLTNKIYEETGQTFNINSPKQLSKVLFEDLNLPYSKKTKSGYSTDVSVLTKLSQHHLVPKLLLNYRHLYKLKSTYTDVLPTLINPHTKKIHTTFHQDSTATGRLSSSDPNLQNIPIRTPEGQEIRSAFIPSSENNVFISADYSQIELKILAHLSEDATMIDTFSKNKDIHQQTASDITGVPLEEITTEMRRVAKSINFGLIYGKTAFGLSKDLNISMAQSQSFINKYFDHFPQIGIFIEKVISQAKKDQSVRTMLNRIRYLPHINSSNKNQREMSERMAVNTVIQGSAADIIKLAMLAVDDYLSQNKLKSSIVLQIHDELLLDVPSEEQALIKDNLRSIMEGIFPLKVPMTVNLHTSSSWLTEKD
ncbi:DNA polymerase I [PVC group bacterium (ex Bugula neritina AB1)]|nr:DNA polymerase I [PVC group bacterium (ex Bugula neritina AB1)]